MSAVVNALVFLLRQEEERGGSAGHLAQRYRLLVESEAATPPPAAVEVPYALTELQPIPEDSFKDAQRMIPFPSVTSPNSVPLITIDSKK